jgi:hypothetical protein
METKITNTITLIWRLQQYTNSKDEFNSIEKHDLALLYHNENNTLSA